MDNLYVRIKYDNYDTILEIKAALNLSENNIIEDFDGNYISFNYDNLENITEKLDNIRIENKKLIYNIVIYNNGNRYPSSVRINKRGKKIFTKQQKKLF